MANDESAEAQIKSKKPSDSAFKQQRLPAWQPVLTAGTVLPTFFIIGIAFIPVGVALLYFSDQVNEHIIDYTNCMRVGDGPEMTCADYLKNKSTENDLPDDCKCVINFTLTEDFSVSFFPYLF
ncbi:TMEM30A family protein [Megaselia abdita]